MEVCEKLFSYLEENLDTYVGVCAGASWITCLRLGARQAVWMADNHWQFVNLNLKSSTRRTDGFDKGVAALHMQWAFAASFQGTGDALLRPYSHVLG